MPNKYVLFKHEPADFTGAFQDGRSLAALMVSRRDREKKNNVTVRAYVVLGIPLALIRLQERICDERRK